MNTVHTLNINDSTLSKVISVILNRHVDCCAILGFSKADFIITNEQTAAQIHVLAYSTWSSKQFLLPAVDDMLSAILLYNCIPDGINSDTSYC